MHYLVPGPTPCPEVVAVFYIRLAKVPTLFSVERDAQVEQQNTVVGFLTSPLLIVRQKTLVALLFHYSTALGVRSWLQVKLAWVKAWLRVELDKVEVGENSESAQKWRQL